MSFIKKKFEKAGIYIFFVSLAMFTQLNWAKNKHSYDDIEFRIFLAITFGFVLSVLISYILKKIMAKSNNCNIEDFLAKTSFSLTPGFLFLFASNSIVFLYLGIGFCFIMFLLNFLSRKRFTNILEITDNAAEIKVKGIYEEMNSLTFKKIFLEEFVLNLGECIEAKITDIKIDFSKLESSDGNELKPMMDEVAKYFNLELSY